MITSVLLLLLGFFLLILGAERLLEGSISLATRYNLPNIIVGLVIISLCTSAPEFFSSLKATYIGPDIAISNILGSNIFNILGILGIVAILQPISARPFTYQKELLLLFFSGGLFAFFLNSNIFSTNSPIAHYSITQVEGGILLLILILSLLYSVLNSKKTKSPTPPKLNSIIIEICYIVLGISLLSIGSHFAITHSIILAQWLGLSQSFIGLTLIGVATGLPELITSLIAIYKKQPDIAIGNIVGSNLFNLLGIIGGVSLIHPISVMQNTTHLTNTLFSSLCVLLLFFTLLWRRNISRTIGALYLCLYISFIGWKLI